MKVIVLDTETTNGLDQPIFYDVGWAVVDTETEETIITRSFAVLEVFTDNSLMQSAYYIEKLPIYWHEIETNKRKLKLLSNIKYQLYQDCKQYGITQIYAHNAIFDYRSCTLSQRYLTGSKWRYFFPYGVEICDTLKLARQLYKNDKSYRDFCVKNNYLTKRNQNRYTAEILYRYISGDNEFEEMHRGLQDVLIEKEILFECLRNGITDGRLWED